MRCAILFAAISSGLVFVWKALLATYFFLGGGEGMVVQKGLFSINYTILRCSNLNLGRMFIQKSLSAYRSAFSKFPSRCGTYQRATKQTQIGLLIHNNTPGLACATGGYDLKFGFKLLQQKYSKSGQGNI